MGAHARPQPDERVTKRAKRQDNTFATRPAECQEQDDTHQGLLGQPSQWESVVSTVCRQLGMLHASQASNDSIQAMVKRNVRYFIKVFGPPGLKRIQDILRSIRQHQSEGRLISNELETQHGLEHSSRPLREWINSIQQQDQARTWELGGAFQRYMAGAQQYEKWMALLQVAEDPTSENYTKMHALGLTTSQGRDVRTNVKAYFLNIVRGFDIWEAAAKEVDIKNPELIKARNSLQNTIAIGRTYNVLQSAYGRGIFLALPEQAPG